MTFKEMQRIYPSLAKYSQRAQEELFAVGALLAAHGWRGETVEEGVKHVISRMRKAESQVIALQQDVERLRIDEKRLIACEEFIIKYDAETRRRGDDAR